MSVYSLSSLQNKQNYQLLLNQTYKEYQSFFKITPKRKPCLFFLKSRQEFDDICGEKTQSWVTGFHTQNFIFLMDEDVYETESSKKFNPEYYPLTLKHELSHYFYLNLASTSKPVWLNEGLAIYLSKQYQFKTPITKFKNFLKFVSTNAIREETVYPESGFVVKKLIDKFGSDKILELIKNVKHAKNLQDFETIFHKIYGFDLNYVNINNL